MLVCYIKRRKSFFHDLFSGSNSWGYIGTPGVTRGYKGLQGVTGVYKGLQGVTTDYRGLQGIKETFFLARTSLDTISWFILYKIKLEEISKF